MAVDVLTYNELVKDVNNLRDVCVPAANAVYSALGTANGSANGASSSFITSTKKSERYGIRLACSLMTCPWDCTLWSKVPSLNSVTGGTLVCDQSGNFRCGSCCLWTVPSDAKFIRFQIWGAGAGSHPTMCCGMSFPGASGAYASVIIPAVPGCQYTLCSGCALCCYQYCTGPSYTTGDGCQSYVTGYGLNNFCADGGDANVFNMLSRARNGINTNICVLLSAQALNSICSRGVYYGYCMCSTGFFCFGSTCSNSAWNSPYTTSCKTYYGNVTNATNNCHFVIGMPGVFPCFCASGSYYNVYAATAPVFGCCCYFVCYYSPDYPRCGGPSPMAQGLASGFGSGAQGASTSAGTLTYCGGIGVMGAVCVQYTTST